jgi:hypothetical protein
MMKRFAWLFLAVLGSATLLNAADKPMNGTMSGWVCDSACVSQQGDRATCDPTCTDRSGKDVFISDEGAVSAITNPDVCTSHINKHVVAKFSRSDRKDIEQAQQDAIEVQELRDEGDLGGH